MNPKTNAESLALIEEVGLKARDGSIRRILAKVDTGADHTSIDEALAIELGLGPIIDTTIVKSSHGTSVRPVIKCEFILKNMSVKVEANLKDRRHLKYPMLIGKDIISRYGFVVNPNQKPITYTHRDPPKSNLTAAVISLGSKSSLWTIEEMTKYFKTVDNINLANIEIRLEPKSPVIIYEGHQLKDYDCIYIKGSFRYMQVQETIARFLYSSCYMPIHPTSFSIVHDKLSTHLTLKENNIPMPATYFAASREAARKFIKSIKYPIILKFPKGTQGKGVMFADSYASANTILDALDSLKQPFIVQEFIETGGVDIRAIVLGDRVAAAMKRKAASDEIRTNIHTGALGEKFELDSKTKALCVRTAKILKAEVCAVDILVGPKGPMVVEANISPGLQGITKATKTNVANEIAEYLYKRTKQFKQQSQVDDTTRLFEELGLSTKKENGFYSLITTFTLRGDSIVVPNIILHKANLLSGDEVDIRFKDGEITFKRFLKK